ncbi:zinc ABC transporter substrate-binding protein [Celeribacter indicus]|uniref:High-affinity zinc uptake system protein ZnuA n=1 Tax=Celeribacter indicus TaxID=1208324 RepID=A0A0B5E6E6_9RHOB|nr:zinc ABC transporter substrate-binding protein [Celeribacter indicus]AJE49015.1 high-affinity zinc uptake system protein ZnuA [Celeribacter indicus]SDW43707.1 zinc transport system substrate-binding protein [Celeribacter indicus]
MSPRLTLTALPFLLAAGAATAEVPDVVTDIAALQSLAAQVMGDLGTPEALMEQGASPHGYALRPSEARALQQADVIFWTSPQLAPWLGEMIDRVAADAHSMPLATIEGTTVLELREGAGFERHVHGGEDEAHGHDDHDHDGEEEHADHDHADHDHDDHAHDDHAHDDHEHETHDDHDHDDHDHDDHAVAHDHDHEGPDAHAWLDPVNARVWLGAMAEELSALDPENAGTYRANAAAAQERIDVLLADVSAEMAPLSDLRFIVFHDAYQYFENRFGLQAAGAISLSDASAPSPARVREIQQVIATQEVSCVFSEPQFNPSLVETVLDGTDAHSAVIDPLGAAIPAGPDYYDRLIRDVAAAFVSCAAQ